MRAAAVVALIVAVAGGGAAGVSWWQHNRMDFGCLITGMWDGGPGYLALKEKVFSGKGDRWDNSALRYTYTFGETGECLPRDDGKYMAFLEEGAARGRISEKMLLVRSLGGLDISDYAPPPKLPAGKLDVKRSFALLRELAQSENDAIQNKVARHYLSLAYRAGWWGDMKFPGGNYKSVCLEKNICTPWEDYLAVGPGENSLTIEKDAEKAEQLLEQLAVENFPHAVWELAWRLRHNDDAQDDNRAAEFFKTLSLLDDERDTIDMKVIAKVQLAWMHVLGLGVDIDGARAESLIAEAIKDYESANDAGKEWDYSEHLLSEQEKITAAIVAANGGG